MSKKIIISIFIIITILQSIIPTKVNAFEETSEIISVPAKIERQKAGGFLDGAAGIILEPTVEFFTVIIDAVIGLLTSFMTQNDFEFVMVSYNNLPSELKQTDDGEEIPTITLTDEEMSEYKRAGGLLDIKFPNFAYSPEEIFAGKIALLDINFFDTDEGKDSSWLNIKNVVSSWYKVLRMVAIIGLLSVLIYTGIKIILSSNTKDKAKYKEMIINWFIAVFLLFSMHYIMSFILNIMEELMELLNDISGTIKIVAGDRVFKTNLIGFARFQMQQMDFTAKVSYLIIYTALVVYTFKFTFIYLKRLLKMAFLTLIAPIVALTYPIDKINDGRAQGFEMWLREYIFNALLQLLHYILYYILVSSAITLAARNLIYGIAALMFISQAEKLLKKIFGFGKARGGTVGGLAGAYATGAITSNLMNFVRNPLHPFRGGKGSGKSGGNKFGTGNYEDNAEQPTGILEDTTNEDDLLNLFRITGTRRLESQNPNSYMPNTDNPNLDNEDNSPENTEENTEENPGRYSQPSPWYGMSDDDQFQSQEEWEEDQQQLRREQEQKDDIDEDEIMQNTTLGSEDWDHGGFGNDYLGMQPEQQQTPEQQQILGPQQTSETSRRTIKEHVGRQFKGAKAVGKRLIRPAWDTEKGAGYNGRRLAGNILRGAAGIGVGLTAAAVQAGISITDGKYNPVEGIATFSAGMAGVANIGKGTKSLGQTYREGASEGENGQAVEEYGKRWFNRDDVISEYNKEFPGKGKKMRERAVKNYISRGIIDAKDQIRAMRFAEQLKSERGLDEEEADKVAIATLQYKQTLAINGNNEIIFDKEKRTKYLDKKADSYTGAASRDSIKQLHNELIDNILDFDRANR